MRKATVLLFLFFVFVIGASAQLREETSAKTEVPTIKAETVNVTATNVNINLVEGGNFTVNRNTAGRARYAKAKATKPKGTAPKKPIKPKKQQPNPKPPAPVKPVNPGTSIPPGGSNSPGGSTGSNPANPNDDNPTPIDTRSLLSISYPSDIINLDRDNPTTLEVVGNLADGNTTEDLNGLIRIESSRNLDTYFNNEGRIIVQGLEPGKGRINLIAASTGRTLATINTHLASPATNSWWFWPPWLLPLLVWGFLPVVLLLSFIAFLIWTRSGQILDAQAAHLERFNEEAELNAEDRRQRQEDLRRFIQEEIDADRADREEQIQLAAEERERQLQKEREETITRDKNSANAAIITDAANKTDSEARTDNPEVVKSETIIENQQIVDKNDDDNAIDAEYVEVETTTEEKTVAANDARESQDTDNSNLVVKTDVEIHQPGGTDEKSDTKESK